MYHVGGWYTLKGKGTLSTQITRNTNAQLKLPETIRDVGALGMSHSVSLIIRI